MNFRSRSGNALLIIDMQRDFLPGGALPVAGGDALIPLINARAREGIEGAAFDAVIASRDWHPADHCSFRPRGPWPVHCVVHTQGAELAPALDQSVLTRIIDKGTDPERESYSAFQDEKGGSTGLKAYLNSLGVKRLFLCGVALDYCVKASALDSVKAGFETSLFSSLTSAINYRDETLALLEQHNVRII